MKGKMKPQGRRSIQGRSLRGLHGRSATNQNGQAAKEEVSLLWRGLDVRKYFRRPGGEKCFSLDIPLNRTSGPAKAGPSFRNTRHPLSGSSLSAPTDASLSGVPRVDGPKKRTTIPATIRTGSMHRNNNDLSKVAKKCPKTRSMVTAPTRPQTEAIPIAVARISVG